MIPCRSEAGRRAAFVAAPCSGGKARARPTVPTIVSAADAQSELTAANPSPPAAKAAIAAASATGDRRRARMSSAHTMIAAAVPSNGHHSASWRLIPTAAPMAARRPVVPAMPNVGSAASTSRSDAAIITHSSTTAGWSSKSPTCASRYLAMPRGEAIAPWTMSTTPNATARGSPNTEVPFIASAARLRSKPVPHDGFRCDQAA